MGRKDVCNFRWVVREDLMEKETVRHKCEAGEREKAWLLSGEKHSSPREERPWGGPVPEMC